MQNNAVCNFIGSKLDNYNNSKAVIFGIPFDGTTSYRPGTRFAPNFIRRESFGIETYSPYLDRDLEELEFYDCGDLEIPFGDTKGVLSEAEIFADKIFSDGKIPVMLGGEHLVTLPVIKAAVKKYPDLYVIHFDAHTDLRDDYLGNPLSHASVIKRVSEFISLDKIYQYGIRSGTKQEFDLALHLHKFDVNGVEEFIKAAGNHPVYITVDLDVLDPSVSPGTGTPEAGGVTFRELHAALRKLSGLNVIGFDLVELSPPYDPSGISTALACVTLREMLLMYTVHK
ncbi:MAG: agmatinase [Ruminococcus sp.]|jgi:agmatinase|nr:agmatinase [Ruminococcus sp.]